MKQVLYKYAGLFLIVVLFAGCMKEPVYPKEPHIEFKSISATTKKSGSNLVSEVVVTLSFRDGDGNLGITDDERTKPPYDDQDGTNKFHFNYFIEPYININGEYKSYRSSVTNGAFPPLSPDKMERTLEGDLRYTFPIFISPLPLDFPDYKSGDLMKFNIQIADRAFNLSNTIETAPVPIYEK